MEATLYTQQGQVAGVIQLNETVFGIEPNIAVMHQAMVRQQANARLGTRDTRTRGEVRGSTRKLYRQKGTGRARQGSIRAPHRRGGGIAHGPHPRSYTKKMPRKMRRLAVRSALSAKYAADAIRFLDTINLETPRTKDMIAILESHGINGTTKALIVLESRNEAVQRSAQNLPRVKTLMAPYVNVIDLLSSDVVLMPAGAVAVIERFLAVDGANSTSDSDQTAPELEEHR